MDCQNEVLLMASQDPRPLPDPHETSSNMQQPDECSPLHGSKDQRRPSGSEASGLNDATEE